MSSSQQDSAQSDWIGALCTRCGLCCNGVLFADVRLEKGDDALDLEQLGLKLKSWDRGARFTQPCACLDGCLCTIYGQRPSRCRAFNCHTLKQAQAGQITGTDALRRIREAKRRAAAIRTLLQSLGNHDEHQAMTRRYQAVMNRPLDLSAGEEAADLRGELMLAVNDLMNRLHRDFLR